uniref:Alpha-carbonic anhydrase domain-containing protein n=1 Tax=Glossina brevipalpis TaxID=37001 RepID=A0A1A9WDB1_9MUSC
MVECSLCSLTSFFGSCLYNGISTALEYPIVVFMLSLTMAAIIISHLQSARMSCNFSKATKNNLNITPIPSSSSSLGNLGNNFNYGPDRGPHTWRCSESNQSPINIIDEYVHKFPIRELLTWNHYDDLPTAVQIENNGHTVNLRACFSGNTPTLSGADLLASYTFVELCFRWSALNSEGSEHMINYRKFPLELQAMHRTGPSGDCTSSYDILMVAYFFEISASNPYLDPIVQHLHCIQKPGTKSEIPPFPLTYLCHQFRTGFYSYGGSLTEPPCYQGAEWFIFPEPLAISERQLYEFRQILCSDGNTRIVRNARPVQSLRCSRVVNLNQYNPIDACNMPESSVCEENCAGDEFMD